LLTESPEGPCDNVPCSQDLLFLQEGTILEDLPSFAKSACRVDQFPDRNGPFTLGIDSNTLVGCGGLGCWSLQNGIWNQAASMIRPRYGAESSTSPRGLFLTGGRTDVKNRTLPFLNTSEILVDGIWEPGPDLPSPLWEHCQVTVGQTIYIAGGTTDAYGPVSNRFYSLDASNLNNNTQWAQLSPMQSATGRRRAGCAYNDGLIYVVGGDRQSTIGPTTTEIYNLTSKTWAFGPSLPGQSDIISAIQYQQEVYVFNVNNPFLTITRLNSTNFEEIKTFDIRLTSVNLPTQIFPSNSCLPVTTTVPTTTMAIQTVSTTEKESDRMRP